MEAYADQIIRVMVELKAEIMQRLNNDEEVKVDHVDEITRRAFKRCAAFYGVTEQTVANKCTKAMNLSRQDFFELVKLYLLTDNTTLEEIVINHRPSEESAEYIRKALQKVRCEL